MEAIRDTVRNVMQALGTKKKGLPQDDLGAILKKALSKKEQGHVKLNYFRKGTLALKVDSSTWLYYLSLKKERLLAKISKKYSGIKDIRFRLGEMQ